jgi:hypothetical protein
VKARLLILLVLFVLHGCAVQSDDAVQPIVSSVTLSPAASTVLLLDTPLQLNLQLFDQYGQSMEIDSSAIWNSSASDVVSVDATGRIIAHQDGNVSIDIRVGDLQAEATVSVVQGSPTLSGFIQYEDKTYNSNNETTSVLQPTRFAEVLLLDEKGYELDRVISGADGSYLFADWIPHDYEIHILAQSSAWGKGVAIKELLGKVHYASHSGNFAAGAANIDLTQSSHPMASAFNILDVFLYANEFMNDQTLDAVIVPPLNVFWEEDNGFDGSYYCNDQGPLGCEQGAGIYVRNEDESSLRDTDEYDDDVLWHEYGHFILENLSRDSSEGGCHGFEENQLKMPLAWSEGWGNFFQSAVKAWMIDQGNPLSSTDGYTFPYLYPYSWYVDTFRDGDSLAINLKDPAPSESFFYNTNEISVAALFLQIYEDSGFPLIWQILVSDAWRNGNEFTNMDLFWDIAVGRYQGETATYSSTALAQLLSTRGIDYSEDAAEFTGNNVVANADLLSEDEVQQHTLYRDDGEADEDWFRLSLTPGQRYTVSTGALRNGADTQMWLYDADGVSLVGENDNFDENRIYYQNACGWTAAGNTADGLASQMTITALHSGDYYLKVATSEQAKVFAGKYGSYEIVFTRTP